MEYIINLDDELEKLIHVCGDWTYLILFVVVFCETGLVILPFLPGDSLLFIVGALAAHGLPIDIWIASIVLTGAAIIGDTVNYQIGSAVGPSIFKKENVRIFNRRHLIRAHEFYEKHGGKTIVLARFSPVVRTCVPLVAGIGKMGYLRFIIFNIAGAIGWVALFVAAGYF
ncbi:MAG: VTT domain-containing protein, partial [Bacillota bacterium]|nr:VTT domain-containing protein [Bacillota bacterium]